MKKLVLLLGPVAILVLIFGTIYGTVQQSQRNEANSPQIQLAQDTAAELNQGVQPAAAVSGKVNLATSLSPFVIIYDQEGHVVAGSGYLNGSIPTVPYGVLTASNGHDYNTVTWEPQSNVRIAAISVQADKYYVLSGRSLKEVEANESQTFLISFVGGLLSLLVLVTMYTVKRL